MNSVLGLASAAVAAVGTFLLFVNSSCTALSTMSFADLKTSDFAASLISTRVAVASYTPGTDGLECQRGRAARVCTDRLSGSRSRHSAG